MHLCCAIWFSLTPCSARRAARLPWPVSSRCACARFTASGLETARGPRLVGEGEGEG